VSERVSLRRHSGCGTPYGNFQTEKVRLYSLELGLCEVESLCHAECLENFGPSICVTFVGLGGNFALWWPAQRQGKGSIFLAWTSIMISISTFVKKVSGALLEISRDCTRRSATKVALARTTSLDLE